MWRIWQICRYVAEARVEYYSLSFRRNGRDFLDLEGVPEETAIDYICKKDANTSVEHRRSVTAELKDCIRQQFLSNRKNGIAIVNGSIVVPGWMYLGLDWKGLPFVDRAYVRQWIYYFHCAFEKHPTRAGILIAVISGLVVLYVGAKLFPSKLVSVIGAIQQGR